MGAIQVAAGAWRGCLHVHGRDASPQRGVPTMSFALLGVCCPGSFLRAREKEEEEPTLRAELLVARAQVKGFQRFLWFYGSCYWVCFSGRIAGGLLLATSEEQAAKMQALAANDGGVPEAAAQQGVGSRPRRERHRAGVEARMTVCCASTIWKVLSLHASTSAAIPAQTMPRSVTKTTRPNANDTFTSTVGVR